MTDQQPALWTQLNLHDYKEVNLLSWFYNEFSLKHNKQQHEHSGGVWCALTLLTHYNNSNWHWHKHQCSCVLCSLNTLLLMLMHMKRRCTTTADGQRCEINGQTGGGVSTTLQVWRLQNDQSQRHQSRAWCVTPQTKPTRVSHLSQTSKERKLLRHDTHIQHTCAQIPSFHLQYVVFSMFNVRHVWNDMISKDYTLRHVHLIPLFSHLTLHSLWSDDLILMTDQCRNPLWCYLIQGALRKFQYPFSHSYHQTTQNYFTFQNRLTPMKPNTTRGELNITQDCVIIERLTSVTRHVKILMI